MNMKKLAILGVMAIGFVVSASVASANHSWNGYHWESGNLSPRVSDKTSSSLYDVSAAVGEWADLGTPVQPTPTKRKANEIIIVESAGITTLGHTDVFADENGHIISAQIMLNTTLLERYGPAMADQVLCHELGHALGLAHNEIDTDTCMNHQAFPGSATSPNAHDAEQLNLHYNHSDAVSSVKKGGGGTKDGGTKDGGGGGKGGPKK